jgi:hypothetical protein
MIALVDNFIKDTEKLDTLYQFYNSIGTNWKYDFLTNKDVEDTSSNFHTTIVKELIEKVYTSQAMKAFDTDDVVGYEPWVNYMEKSNDGLSYHMDCNENSNGAWEHGKVTAILYLGHPGEMVGGNLVLNGSSDAVENFYNMRLNKRDYTEIGLLKGELLEPYWINIPYKYNRLVLFDPSKYPHAVTPMKKNCSESFDKRNRLALQITAWNKEIKILKEERYEKVY